MAQVTLSINGRTYRVGCGDGEESRLRQLAAEVATRVDRLVMEFGQVGEARLLLMAALLATDEVLDLRAERDAMVTENVERLRSMAEAAARNAEPRAKAPAEAAGAATTTVPAGTSTPAAPAAPPAASAAMAAAGAAPQAAATAPAPPAAAAAVTPNTAPPAPTAPAAPAAPAAAAPAATAPARPRVELPGKRTA